METENIDVDLSEFEEMLQTMNDVQNMELSKLKSQSLHVLEVIFENINRSYPELPAWFQFDMNFTPTCQRMNKETIDAARTAVEYEIEKFIERFNTDVYGSAYKKNQKAVISIPVIKERTEKIRGSDKYRVRFEVRVLLQIPEHITKQRLYEIIPRRIFLQKKCYSKKIRQLSSDFRQLSWADYLFQESKIITGSIYCNNLVC
jgi:hypothetical protein